MRAVYILVVAAAFIVACSAPPDHGDIAGTSPKFTLEGTFDRIDMNRVDAVAIEDGKLVVHGVGLAKEDLPADADASTPAGHWSLTTETDTGKSKAITFTHDETLDEFTIELPARDVEVHYGTLKSKSGKGDVMLMAWGENNRCYWGYVTITPKAGAS